MASDADPADAAKVSRLVLDLVKDQLVAQLATADNYDVKATAVLAFVGVALTLVLGSQTTLGHAWWLAAVLLLLAGAAAVLCIRDRAFQTGPDAKKFYNRFGGLEENAAQVTLLSHMIASNEANKNPLMWKSRFFVGSLWLLIAAAGTAVILAVWHP